MSKAPGRNGGEPGEAPRPLFPDRPRGRADA